MRDGNPDAEASARSLDAPTAAPDPALPGSTPRRETECLARAFHALVALVSGLIVLGALVRAHGAGLACPDWPLCFGEAMPRLDFRAPFQFAHRVPAASIPLPLP